MEKKKIIFICVAVFCFCLLLSFGFSFLFRVKLDNSGFVLKDKLQVEVYSKVKVKDFITSIDGKVIKEDKIDTTKLTKEEVTFLYLNKNKKKRKGTFQIEVVDKTEPLIWLSNTYSLPVGSQVNLEEKILCADNYDQKPTCKIKGQYDLNKKGTYQLEYEAIDSSGNKEVVPFTLYVYEKNKEKNVSAKSNEKTIEKSSTSFSSILKDYKTKNTEVGIDVSKWQGEIDFKKVKEAQAEFVMIRLGYQKGVHGELILDDNFKRNIENALANNLKVGVYFYSYASSEKEAIQQARFVLKNIKKYDVFLPIAFDWECYSNFNSMELSLFSLNSIANRFLDEIKKNNYDTMIYASKNYLKAIWMYQDQNVWLAHYTKKTDYDGKYKMWQLCENGKIEGISSFVDIDILYK